MTKTRAQKPVRVGFVALGCPKNIVDSEKMLAQEISYLNEDFKRSAIVEQPAQFARHFADNFYDITFRKTRIQAVVIWLATPTSAAQTGRFRKQLHNWYLKSNNYRRH